jgi:hypothetical protein
MCREVACAQSEASSGCARFPPIIMNPQEDLTPEQERERIIEQPGNPEIESSRMEHEDEIREIMEKFISNDQVACTD